LRSKKDRHEGLRGEVREDCKKTHTTSMKLSVPHLFHGAEIKMILLSLMDRRLAMLLAQSQVPGLASSKETSTSESAIRVATTRTLTPSWPPLTCAPCLSSSSSLPFFLTAKPRAKAEATMLSELLRNVQVEFMAPGKSGPTDSDPSPISDLRCPRE
jgi:hypothetical protein